MTTRCQKVENRLPECNSKPDTFQLGWSCCDIFVQQNTDQTKVGRDIPIRWANSAPPGWNRVIKKVSAKRWCGRISAVPLCSAGPETPLH